MRSNKFSVVLKACTFSTERRSASQRHPYHLVTNSPWPFFTAITVGAFAFGIVLFFHAYTSTGLQIIGLGFKLLLIVIMFWWRDVIREATLEGQHTLKVQRGLVIGIILFIISEILFFFAFFWSYFYFSFNPTVAIAMSWPPVGLEIINPFDLPLFNTILLLTSGFTVTWSHHAILARNRFEATVSLLITILLGALFLETQLLEYKSAPFSISDSVYGSIFYLMTGFHGFHVLIGTCFLFVCLIRLLFNHFSLQHHIGFEAAAWYWHFVDVVWLLLFFVVYIWGIL